MKLNPCELEKLIIRVRHWPNGFTVTAQEVEGLVDTIEANQAEIAKLQTKNDNQSEIIVRQGEIYKTLEDKHNELLQYRDRQDEQIAKLKEQLGKAMESFKQVQHDIDNAECRDDLDGIKGYIDEALSAIE
jgi:chromosome segregation ATPase